MNMRKLTLLALAAAFTVSIVMYCGRNPIAGNGTQIGNPVASMLYNPGGTPAKNAKVTFCPASYNPKTGLAKMAPTVDSTTTDTNGNYFITLNTGTYTVTASGDSGLAFTDSIIVIKTDTVRPNPDTLKPAGSIRGVVRLEEGGDPRTIFILFMGTRTFTWPDDQFGNFTSGAMAAGHYRVRLITTTPDYLPLDDTLTVNAGHDDTLADTIVLKYNGIPVPKNVRIVYDTLKQIVNLSWDSASANLVSSYNIYRRNVGLNTILAMINTSPVTGSSYRDTTGVQDSTYEYRVAAVNAGTMEGTKSAAVRVVIHPAFHLSDSILISSSGWVRLDVDTLGNAYVGENNNITRYDRSTKAVTGSWSLAVTFGKIQQLKWLNDTALIVATTGKIGRYILGDSTVRTLCTDSAILVISLSNDTVFYIQGLWPDPNCKIKKLVPGADSGLTVISVNTHLPSLGVNDIENLTVTQSTILFSVYRTIPGTTEDREDVYQADHDGKNLILVSSLPWYTNQGASFSVAGSSYYLSTHEYIASTGINITTFREYALPNGEILAQWKNFDAYCELVRIIQSQVYVKTLGRIYVYSK
jgi:hypothetical protein